MPILGMQREERYVMLAVIALYVLFLMLFIKPSLFSPLLNALGL